jgi:hypothetical protein
MADQDFNPLKLTVNDVTIQKFNGQDKISLRAQFIEFTVYQSLFESSIKGELLINDQIGLFVNYPFTGEEFVTIEYQQNMIDSKSSQATKTINLLSPVPKTINFIIKGVRDISVGDRARSMMYVVDLISPYFLQNTRKYVQHSYSDNIEKIADDVFTEYVLQDTQIQFNITKPFVTEPTLKKRTLVIPNLRPYQAITWLTKYAVSQYPEDYYYYIFYEDFEQFNFVTLQKLIEEAAGSREKIDKLIENKYIYRSDTEISDYIPSGDINEKLKQITNIVNNKRFSSIEKIAGGYYQNEMFEISLLQKSYKSTVTELSPTNDTKFNLGKYPLNTPEYIQSMKNEKALSEYANRVRYVVNNYQNYDSDDGVSQPQFREKFGRVTKRLFALGQIDLSFTIPANMDIKAGEVIWIDIPENHGFNIVNPDIYLSGLFIVAEVKQVISTGYRAATSVRVHKDGYLNKLIDRSNYNSSVTSPRVGSNGRILGTV